MIVESYEETPMRAPGRRWLFMPLLFFLAPCMAARRLVSDSTVYAPGYSEGRFRSIRIGMSKEEVIRALGEPLRVETVPGYVLWVYAPKDYRNPGPQGDGPFHIPPDTAFRADPAGKIISVTGSYLDINNDDLLGHQLDEVRKRFGSPLEVYSAPARDLYWYTKMDGVKGHLIRIVHISRDGTVCDINAGCIGYYVGPEDEQNLSWIDWLELNL